MDISHESIASDESEPLIDETIGKDVTVLEQGSPIQTVVEDCLFFKFEVQDCLACPDLANELLLLNVSKKSDLQVFIGNDGFPGSEDDNYDYAVGDIKREDVE